MDAIEQKNFAKLVAKEIDEKKTIAKKAKRTMLKSGSLKLLEKKLTKCNLLDEYDELLAKAKTKLVPNISTIDSKQRNKLLDSLPNQTLEWLSERNETTTKSWEINIYASLIRLRRTVIELQKDDADIYEIIEVLNQDDYLEGYTLDHKDTRLYGL